jgi:16S rRNA (guanine966-N2)-methyltransferase
MRVVAGELRGRRLRSVPGMASRPTGDKVREALFSILGGRVAGTRVLDLFAGTGALAIEALSRGAASAVLVEPAPAAVGVIRANLAELDLADRAVVRRTRAEAWLRTQRDGPFDLALLDPPYASPPGYVAGVLGRLARTALAPGATVVLEAATRSEAPPWPPDLEPARPRRYGDTTLHIAAYTGSGAGAADRGAPRQQA